MLIQNFEFYEVISGGIQNTDIDLLCVVFFFHLQQKRKKISNDVERLNGYSICVTDFVVVAFEINIQECLLW